jgi:uncharacterized protein (TIGR00159 family)
MKPRRPVFALDYIGETVDAFEQLLKLKEQGNSFVDNGQVKWSYDVLRKYFEVVGSHEIIAYEKEKFVELTDNFRVEESQRYIPYKRLIEEKREKIPTFESIMTALFQIGFLEIRFLDLVDIFLVGVLIYQLFRLVRGSLAFHIFLGLLVVYLVAIVVRTLNMELLSGILGQFVGVGVIAVLIVFQPEVRRFLLYVGRGSRFGRDSIWNKFSISKWRISTEKEVQVNAILKAVDNFSRTNTGALIVYSFTSKLQFIANTGVILEARISSSLLESIFYKNNPLHDGAVIIADNKVQAAKCVLPVSENPNIPGHYGMRHRAAVGISEHSDAFAIVVSEERGQISYAYDGKLYANVDSDELKETLMENLLEKVNRADQESTKKK